MKKRSLTMSIALVLMICLFGCSCNLPQQSEDYVLYGETKETAEGGKEDMREGNSALTAIYDALSKWLLRLAPRDLDYGLEVAVMGRIIATLDNNDKDALRGLFSQTALAEAQNIDEEIDLIMELYEGVMTDLVRLGAANHADRDFGRIIWREFYSIYTITTSENIYRLLFTYVDIDEDNPANIGLYEIQFMTYEHFTLFKWAEKRAGIYVPELQND